jgi:hypothetical protein
MHDDDMRCIRFREKEGLYAKLDISRLMNFERWDRQKEKMSEQASTEKGKIRQN